MSSTVPYSVASRESTIKLLQALLNNEVDADGLEIDFSAAKWVGFHLKLDGFHYKSSLDSGLMKSLIEYQNTLYRLAAYVKNNNLNGNAITDLLKEKLELKFIISEGSSDVKADWWQALVTMVTEVASGMSTKAKLILVLGLAITVGGGLVVEKVIDAWADVKKEEVHAADHAAELRLIHESIETQGETNKMLAGALAQQPKIAEIQKQFENATSEIIRQSSRADLISIQGVTISGAAARTLLAPKRQTSQDVQIQGLFSVFDLNSKDPDAFHCSVERISDKLVVHAGLYDALMSAQAKEIIYTAFRERKKVRLVVVARQLRGNYSNARVVSAEIIPDE